MGKNKNKKAKETEVEDVPPAEVEDEGVAAGDADDEGDDGEGEAGVGENAVVDMDEGDDEEPEEEIPPEVVQPALAQSEANEAKRQADPMQDAHAHLDALLKFCKGKKEEHLLRDHGINRVHSGMILEMGENKAKGRLTHFSDGHREMLKSNYNALVKAGKIKS